MWIMNSEFRPVKKADKNNGEHETPEDSLRSRLKTSLDQFPEIFATMKKHV